MSQDTIILAKDVLAGTSGTLSREIKSPGGAYLRHIKIAFDSSSAYKVNVQPYIIRHGASIENLITYAEETGSKQMIDGEGGLWMEFPVAVLIERNETICLDYENNDLVAHVVTAHFFVERRVE
jgi:hypothetical protein